MDYGEGRREYACITGRGRRGGPRPAGIEGVQQVGFHGYALVRTTAGNAPAAPGGGGLQGVRVLGQGDLDRLGDYVGAIAAAAEVLRVPVHRSDEVDGKTEGDGLELDRGLRLDATSGHWPPSSKLPASAGRSEGGKACAVTPAGPSVGAGQLLQGVRVEIPELVGGGSLIIKRAPPRLSESRVRGQCRRSLSAGSSLRSRREMAQTRPSPSHST